MSEKIGTPVDFIKELESGVAEFVSSNSRNPSTNEMKVIKASAFIHTQKTE
jgi:hypothetical protein